MEIFQDVENSFQRADSGKNTSLKWLSKFRKCMNSTEDTKYQESPPTRKTDETVN